MCIAQREEYKIFELHILLKSLTNSSLSSWGGINEQVNMVSWCGMKWMSRVRPNLQLMQKLRAKSWESFKTEDINECEMIALCKN